MHTSMRRARAIVATCAVPVSVQCTNAKLPAFGGDLVLVQTMDCLSLSGILKSTSRDVDLRAYDYCLNAK